MSDFTLNVIFHGTFLFHKEKPRDNTKTRMLVYIPKITNHVVKAGNWLGETELKGNGAVYKLGETKQGGAELEDKHHLVIRHIKPDPHNLDKPDELVYAKIEMNVPHKISTPRRARVENSQFSLKTDSHPDGKDLPNSSADQATIDGLLTNKYEKKLGTLTIFTYEFEDITDLRLEEHPWVPVFQGSTGTVNLHIISAHEVEEDLTEGRTAFNALTKLIVDYRVALRPTEATGQLKVHELPFGVIPEECEDLNLRLQRMAKLGRTKKNDLDLNDLWHPDDGFDDEPSACTCACCC